MPMIQTLGVQSAKAFGFSNAQFLVPNIVRQKNFGPYVPEVWQMPKSFGSFGANTYNLFYDNYYNSFTFQKMSFDATVIQATVSRTTTPGSTRYVDGGAIVGSRYIASANNRQIISVSLPDMTATSLFSSNCVTVYEGNFANDSDRAVAIGEYGIWRFDPTTNQSTSRNLNWNNNLYFRANGPMVKADDGFLYAVGEAYITYGASYVVFMKFSSIDLSMVNYRVFRPEAVDRTLFKVEVAISNGFAYFAILESDYDLRLIKMNLSTNAFVWCKSYGYQGKPKGLFVDAGLVYYVGNNSNMTIIAVSAADGSPVWTKAIGSFSNSDSVGVANFDGERFFFVSGASSQMNNYYISINKNKIPANGSFVINGVTLNISTPSTTVVNKTPQDATGSFSYSTQAASTVSVTAGTAVNSNTIAIDYIKEI